MRATFTFIEICVLLFEALGVRRVMPVVMEGVNDDHDRLHGKDKTMNKIDFPI